MTAQRISARSLVRETFATIGSLLVPLLIITSPFLIMVVVNVFGKLDPLGLGLYVTYWLGASSFSSRVLVVYTHRRLTGNQVTVGEAFKQANTREPNLIFANHRELIKGRESLMMRGIDLLGFMVVLPLLLILRLTAPMRTPLTTLVTGTIIGSLFGQLVAVYFVILYLRLRESAATIQ